MKNIQFNIGMVLLCALVPFQVDAGALRNEPQVFDQRQNGTENYRINVDGVVLAIAPAEEFLAAASSIDLEELLQMIEDPESAIANTQSAEKPTPTVLGASSSSATSTQEQSANKPSADKPLKKKGLKMRLSNLLLPLLRKSRNLHYIKI